jgi:hypothetical protein
MASCAAEVVGRDLALLEGERRPRTRSGMREVRWCRGGTSPGPRRRPCRSSIRRNRRKGGRRGRSPHSVEDCLGYVDAGHRRRPLACARGHEFGHRRPSRVGRSGTGVWRGRTAGVSNRCTSWPPVIALPGRQGRSSRLAPGPDPGDDRLAISAARLAGIALPLFRGDRRVGAASVWVVLGAQRRSMPGASAANWPAGRGRIQEGDRFLRPECAGTQEDDLSARPGLPWHWPRDGGTGRA